MKQLTFTDFPKHRPNITLDDVQQYIARTTPFEEPSNVEIRLAKELAIQRAPEMKLHCNHIVREILGTDVPDSKINKVKTFKQITKKRIIIPTPQGHRVIKVIRRRKK